jgi:hypothetical protein
MAQDEIVAEVRRVREAYAARFNFDIDAISGDLRDKERRSTRKKVSFPPRRTVDAEAPPVEATAAMGERTVNSS